MLRGQADSAALVAITAHDELDSGAEDALTRFLTSHREAIAACIDATTATTGCAK